MKIKLVPFASEDSPSLHCFIKKINDSIQLTFEFSGTPTQLETQPLVSSQTELLWQGTCFELFVKDESGTGYREFNFSPDQRFTSYYHAEYRETVHAQTKQGSHLTKQSYSNGTISFEMLLNDINIDDQSIAVTAVTTDSTGISEYWGVNHWDNTPDFHREENFFIYKSQNS